MIRLEDAKKRLLIGQTIYHTRLKNADGTPQRWRVNGKVKRWKRDPDKIRIPIKRGLYEYSYLTHNDSCLNWDLENFCLTEEDAILSNR